MEKHCSRPLLNLCRTLFVAAGGLIGCCVLILNSGCAKKPRQVDVQVFIVTNSGDNVKLGLVDVRAIPLKRTIDALQPLIAERDAAVAKLDSNEAAQEKEFSSRVEQHKSELNAAGRRNRAAFNKGAQTAAELKKATEAAAIAASTYLESFRKKVDIVDPGYATFAQEVYRTEQQLDKDGLRATVSFDPHWFGDISVNLGEPDRAIEIVSRQAWDVLRDQHETVLRTARAFKASIEEAKATKAEVARLSTPPEADFRSGLAAERKRLIAPERFLAALPAPTSSAKTDADGRCRLILPANEHWVLAANGSRQLLNTREEYVWIVDLPETQGAQVTLSLSNDNVLKPGANPLALRGEDGSPR